MENATKALLIAAAILIAILIISLGLVVYNMASETVQGISLNDTEVKAFNDKWTHYTGESVSGTTVNALISDVFTNNMTADNAKQITLTIDKAINDEELTVEPHQQDTPAKVPTGNRYKVTVTYNTSTKLIDIITCTKK